MKDVPVFYFRIDYKNITWGKFCLSLEGFNLTFNIK